MNVLTKDLKEVELTYTPKVNGPHQIGGLSFGTTYLYYRLSGGDWKRAGDKSQVKVKNIIEHSLSSELESRLV